MASSTTIVDASVFEGLQAKIDEDATVRELIKNITQTLERQGRTSQAILSRAHSTRAAERESHPPHSSTYSQNLDMVKQNCHDKNDVIVAAEKSLREQVESIRKLASLASDFPYYKYNGLWTRDVQNVVFSVLFCAWLGGMVMSHRPALHNRLLTMEEVGEVLCVPVNLKDRDAFHITIEEYLQALISLIEELARLAINSVTLGDYQRPQQISQFVKDLHAGFQILNLKNDALRRRSDAIKYHVKKIEDIVYDLTLRNLLPKTETDI